MRAPGQIFVLLTLSLTSSPKLFALTTNCGTGAPGNAITFTTANAQSVNGCEDVDTFFASLNLSANSGPSGPVSNDQIFILGSFNSTTNPTLITATFNPADVSGERWDYVHGNDTGTIVSQFDWTVAIDPSFLGPSNLPYVLTGVTAGLTNDSGTSSTRTITVTNAVCLNTSSVCSGSPDFTLTLFNNGSSPANVSSGIPSVTLLSIRSTVTLDKPENGTSPSLGSFFVQFNEITDVPEPATAPLAAGALIGMAAWARRSVRKRRSFSA